MIVQRTWLSTVAYLVVAAGVAMTVSLTPAAASADEIRNEQWMIEALNLPEAWKITKGAGVTVGIVDTGVDATHPDLAGRVLPGIDVVAPAVGAGDGLADPAGHGTAVASLIAGQGHGSGGKSGIVGVAPEATILSVRGLSPFDIATEVPPPTDTARGIRWLADNGADIILLAYGGRTVGDEAEKEAVRYAAIERGIPVVAGAGNRGYGSLGKSSDPGVGALANYPEVMAVSGSTKEGEFWDRSAYGPEVFVAAPAGPLPVAGLHGGYELGFQGTSASSAITAGVLALLKSQFPDESRIELWWRLGELVTDAGEAGPDDQFGFGVIDPVAALTGDPGPLPDHLADPEPTATHSHSEETATTADGPVLRAHHANPMRAVGIIVIVGSAGLAALVSYLRLRRRNP